MTPRGRLALAAVIAAAATVAAPRLAHAGASDALAFCDRANTLTASQQDLALRFAAVVRDELNALGTDTALISRSGLDLSRFDIRFSHTAIAWRSEAGAWSARQLYYACDERRPRLYDQGLAGFAMGIDDASLGHVAIVRLPDAAAASLHAAALDTRRALHLLSATYSANAYPFSLRYQNCNQWVIEMLAVAWGDLPDADDLRPAAQQWLAAAHYDPEPVAVGSHALMFASGFVPFLHLDDHPEADRFAQRLKVSLPSTIEAFVHARRLPQSERIEVCHNARQVVVRRGWTPIAEGCRPGDGDRVISLD